MSIENSANAPQMRARETRGGNMNIDIKPKEPLANYLERKTSHELEALAALIHDGKVSVRTMRHYVFDDEFMFEIVFTAREQEDA